MSTASSSTDPDRGVRGVNSRAMVVVLSFAGITAALMQTLVIPLIGDLPVILGTSATDASWVITATLLTSAVMTPVAGRLGDLFGKRRIMLLCAGVLVLGSALCAVASSLAPMVIGRGMQGAAMGLIPLGISAMRDLVPAEKLGTSIAVMSASMGVGGALGLPIAAAVAERGSWRLLFWGSAVLAVVIMAMIGRNVPQTPITASGGFDLLGALGLGAGLVTLLLAVSKGGDWGWASATTLGLLASSLVILVGWSWFELRRPAPLVDLRVSARPVVLLTNLASLVLGFAMYAQALIVPQLIQLPAGTGYGHGQSMLEMGLWMMPGGLVMMLVAPLGARVSSLRGPRVTLALGAFVVGVGYVSLVLLLASLPGLLLGVAICSAGVGLAYGAMPALIMGSVPLSETASANSFNTLMRSVGTSVAAAVVGAVLAGMAIDFGGVPVPSKDGFVTSLLLGAGVAFAASLIALGIPSRGSPDVEGRIERDLAPADV